MKEYLLAHYPNSVLFAKYSHDLKWYSLMHHSLVLLYDFTSIQCDSEYLESCLLLFFFKEVTESVLETKSWKTATFTSCQIKSSQVPTLTQQLLTINYPVQPSQCLTICADELSSYVYVGILLALNVQAFSLIHEIFQCIKCITWSVYITVIC